jgi:hypothetical protein
MQAIQTLNIAISNRYLQTRTLATDSAFDGVRKNREFITLARQYLGPGYGTEADPRAFCGLIESEDS